MRSIDITSTNVALGREVATRVVYKLNERNENAFHVELYSTMLSKILRIVRSYYGRVRINRLTNIFIETAIEYQRQVEYINPKKKTNELCVNSSSFMVEVFRETLTDNSPLKIITKRIVKKIGLLPSYIFYLKDSNVIKLRAQKAYIGRLRDTKDCIIEDPTLTNIGKFAMRNFTEKSVNNISKIYGSKACIIDVSNKNITVDQVVDQIIDFIYKDNPMWLNSYKWR